MECPPYEGRMVGKEVSVVGFWKQRGWGMCRSVVPCAYGYAVVFGVYCTWRTPEKNPKSIRRTCPLTKTTKSSLFFNSKTLCGSVSLFLLLKPLYLCQAKDKLPDYPVSTSDSNTPVLCSGSKTRRGRKWRIHFSRYFFRESSLMSLGMVPHITNISIWIKSDIVAHMK